MSRRTDAILPRLTLRSGCSVNVNSPRSIPSQQPDFTHNNTADGNTSGSAPYGARATELAGDEEYSESYLADLLKRASSTLAGSPRAYNTTAAFEERICSIITKARKEGVCSFNDYREHLGLRRMLFVFPGSLPPTDYRTDK